MQAVPRITVEAPVLSIGGGAHDYEGLGRYVDALRRPQGLHLTFLHLGVLEDFARDVGAWTGGITTAGSASHRTVSWLQGLPVFAGFSGTASSLIVLGSGGVSGLEIDVPPPVREYQISLVVALHQLLGELLVDNIDDFILSSRALGFRSPRWLPHVAVGRPRNRGSATIEIGRLAVEFGDSRIRNGHLLPGVD